MQKATRHTLLKKITEAALALGVVVSLVACGPEDGRARGGGMGADVGNRSPDFVPASKVYQAPGEDSVKP